MNFSGEARDYLSVILARAQHSPVDSWTSWWLDGCPFRLGRLSVERAERLSAALPADAPLARVGGHYLWHAAHLSASERSEMLQSIAEELRNHGLITGWRGEAFSTWGHRQDSWPYEQPELFRLERAAFRYFGLRSHAVHVHGLGHDGRMWCGRRSLSKAIDPDRLDNLAAGGIPAGEGLEECAIREVFEEAGLTRTASDLIGPQREVLTERLAPEGWHSERLFVFSLALGPDDHPVNQDGEVSRFHALEAAEVIDLIRTGSFTEDAACAIAATFCR